MCRQIVKEEYFSFGRLIAWGQASVDSAQTSSKRNSLIKVCTVGKLA